MLFLTKPGHCRCPNHTLHQLPSQLQTSHYAVKELFKAFSQLGQWVSFARLAHELTLKASPPANQLDNLASRWSTQAAARSWISLTWCKPSWNSMMTRTGGGRCWDADSPFPSTAGSSLHCKQSNHEQPENGTRDHATMH